MCQLYAMNSSRLVSIRQALRAFTARGGATDDHVDGWGIAFHNGGGSRVFIDPHRAADSKLASFLCRYPVYATTVLAHVRKATYGKVAGVNCHPFQREWRGRRWSFSHNGTLLDFTPHLAGDYLPVGQTDSERAFCWLLEQLHRRLPGQDAPHWRDVAPLLAELATRVGRHGKFNFTLTDGSALYALGATRLAWQQCRPTESQIDLLSQHAPLDRPRHHQPPPARVVQIATEPLDTATHWRHFAPGELMVFVQGEPVWARQLDLPVLRHELTALAA
ncbi:MAG: class II glutamine amidotransferase [Leptothrix sp. (in: b-proteobacteria)]